MKTIAVINQKGGVAKTTTSSALAAGLRHRGATVLMVDLDAQGNLTSATGASPKAADTMKLLRGEKIKPAQTPQGDIFTSTPALTAADVTLTDTGKEYRLKEALDGLQYDFAVVDTPPALSVLTVNALTAADYAIIPARADLFSLQGIAQLAQTIDAVRRYCNPALDVLGIVLTMYNKRTILQRDTAAILEQTAQQIGTTVFDTRIRPCSALSEAQARRQDIFTYSPRSNAAADYNALIDEIIERMK